MSDVFILGAGFSKAISDEMPITKELAKQVVDRYLFKDRIEPMLLSMIEEDEGQGFEKALTYLTQDKPWLSESDNLRHKALYLDFANVIRGIFHEKMRSPGVWGINSPPLWLEALITYWHDNRCAVLTLNYDTLIERVASSTYWVNRPTGIPTGRLYPTPLTPAERRAEWGWTQPSETEKAIETFKLFKLHGSTNWFYSGRSDFFGEELYYVPCKGGVDGPFDAAEGRGLEKRHWQRTSDKVPLIIPPTLDKSAFFQHESLRSTWFQAGEAIKRASRIICMGYSLPTSDLTMAQFLKNSAPPNQIPLEIVDLSAKEQHFSQIAGNGYKYHQKEVGVDCVPRFVIKNCIPKDKDKLYVTRMTVCKEHSGEPT